MPEYRDATKNMYLADIGKRDVDNFGLLFKHCKHYIFEDRNAAVLFFAECVNEAFKRLGIDNIDKAVMARMANVNPKEGLSKEEEERQEEEFDTHMRKHNVTYEYRPKSHYKDFKDIERRGFYIFKANEIAYFIGSPKILKKIKGPTQSILVLPGRFQKDEVKYRVSTNVPINQPKIVQAQRIPSNSQIILPKGRM